MSELIAVEKINQRKAFTSENIDPLVDKVEKHVMEFERDVTTQKGRDEIASLAYKVARSKTAVDKVRKDLGADLRAELDNINSVGKKAVERLEQIKQEFRKPLTEYEEKEKNRVHELEQKICSIDEIKNRNLEITAQVDDALSEVIQLEDYDFQEFSEKAQEKILKTKEYLQQRRKDILRIAEERAELQKLREEKEQLARERAEIERQKNEIEAAKSEKEETPAPVEKKDVQGEKPVNTPEDKSRQEIVKDAAIAGIVKSGIPNSFAEKLFGEIMLGNVPYVYIDMDG